MCQACANGEPKRFTRKVRRKLWELAECYHCIVLGTCLTLDELNKLTPRAGLMFKPGTREYVIHASYVTCVSKRRDVAKLLHKLLERKYKSAVAETKPLHSDDALCAYWEKNLESGSVPGPFWAIMTHPHASETFRTRVFGDVHMLSHMVGAANQSKLRRLEKLEIAHREAAVAAEEERLRNRRLLEDRNVVVADLSAKLASQSKLRGRIVALEAQVAQFESKAAYSALNGKLREQQRDLDTAETRAQRAEQQLLETKAQLATAQFENADLKRSLTDSRNRADRIERLLESRLFHSLENALFGRGDDAGTSGEGLTAELFDLDGATIVYVGGRSSQIQHFRKLVETSNGNFVHHDGGLEDSDTRLKQVLGRGDIVMCPIDCVSHSACQQAKKFCKHAGKCFVPLRTAGLSCFVNSLENFSKPT